MVAFKYEFGSRACILVFMMPPTLPRLPDWGVEAA